jgi:hypothetical protein
VDPVPDPLLLRKNLVAPGIEHGTSGPDHRDANILQNTYDENVSHCAVSHPSSKQGPLSAF